MELGAGEAIPRPQERHQTTGVEGAVSSIKETIRVSVGWWETIFSLSLHTDFPNLSIKILCENVQQTDTKIVPTRFTSHHLVVPSSRFIKFLNL